MSWWDIETAAADGLISPDEVKQLAMIEVTERVAERRADARSRARYKRERRTIEVLPQGGGELDLLLAVQAANDEHLEEIRTYTWYCEAVARGEEPDIEWIGPACADAIAAAYMGLPIKEAWKLRHPRRIVGPLRRLLADGLVCRGDRQGSPYGYELTEAGAAMLDAEGIAA